jgi:hypothetical protein
MVKSRFFKRSEIKKGIISIFWFLFNYWVKEKKGGNNKEEFKPLYYYFFLFFLPIFK